MASRLRLHTFGGPWVEGPSGPLTQVAAQRRRLALLALVAASGPAGISRDRTIALLWPDSEPARARRSLAQLLYGMRHSLEATPVLSDGELRLDPAVMSSDVGDFLAAASDGNEAAVAQLGTAPFLDGFYLEDAAEFSRWTEEQRESLRHRVAQAELALARAAEARGAPGEGVERWRRLSAQAPLDARPTLGLMRALAAAGDRNAAMQVARSYEQRVRAELGVEPDREIRSLAAKLARELVATPQGSSPPRPSPIASAAPPVAAPAGPSLSTRRPGRRALIAIGAVLTLLAVGAFVIRQRRPHGSLAVGTIRFAGVDSNSTAAILSDMLATSLARLSGIQVLSTARVLELRGQLRSAGGADTTLSIAAARAGAGEILEGVVHQLPGGTHLRLDLRRVDLSTGTVRGSYRIEADDIYQVADAATGKVAADLALPIPAGTVAGVTTSSLVAYRFYIQGLSTLEDADELGALHLFRAALAEDSTFAIAAFHVWSTELALDNPDGTGEEDRARMLRLASRATDHDRLVILAAAAATGYEPIAIKYADTLAFLYPRDVQVQSLVAGIRLSSGDFDGALAATRRVISLEAGESSRELHPCRLCDAYATEITALQQSGQVLEGLQLARIWSAEAPRSITPKIVLSGALDRAFATESSLAVIREVSLRTGGRLPLGHLAPAMILERGGRFDEVRTLLTTHRPDQTDNDGIWSWYYWTDLRNRGQFEDAYRLMRTGRISGVVLHHIPDPGYTAQALIDFELGHLPDAIRRLDTLPSYLPGMQGSVIPHYSAWATTHLAYYLWSAGDTARLSQLSDSVERMGRLSLYARDQRLHYFIDGLLSVSRHRDAEAVASFRQAISSWTDGYTRINFELARALMRIGHPEQAVPPLQAALRGVLDASALYLTQTELHETLAKAFDAAGQRDSAEAQFQWVARAWQNGDPPFQARAAQAAERARQLAELTRDGRSSR